ncbi:MAG: DUF3106 domain-containing protein [Acidobacteria bacterium]|nr:DUF3106 domain-containing protein [Acidobacteriota bacterium]
MRLLPLAALFTLAFSLSFGQAPSAPRSNNAVERLRAMPPDERRKALEKLPPDRRKQAEARMEELDRMSPEERGELARRYDSFQRLSAADQEKARKLFRDLNDLPGDRREALRLAIGHIHEMSSAERTGFLGSAEARSRYNRKERTLLQDYVALLEAPSR